MKYAILTVLLLLAVPFASANLVTTGTALDAELLYYQPVPAQPGDEIDLYIQVENNGGTASKKGTLTVVDSGPFIIESSSQRVREFPSIPAQETFLIKAEARIAKDASEGINTFRVSVQEDGSPNSRERDLEVTVTARDSTLSIVSAETVPAEMLPGEEGTLNLLVENVGTTIVRNVDVTLDLEGLSLVPIGNSDSKTVARMAGSEQQLFSFKLVSFPDAPAQAYQIPLTLEYEDETGNDKTQEETVGIVIGAKPELLVYFDDMSLTEDNTQGAVTIRFVNKGLAEIKLAEVEVLQSDSVEVTSESNILYVGNIDEDDYESAQFTISVDGDTTLPVEVRFRDALNREYTENFNLPVRLQENGNGNGGFGVGGWLVILIVVGGGIWYWRKRKKGK